MRPAVLVLLFLHILTIAAEEVPDSSATHIIEEVVVNGRRETSEVIPGTTLSGEELHNLSSSSVADAMRYFSGVQIKDYGGVGGIKTVNIRSMGTNHTGVVYDGVELGNAQNGQTDLGQFSLDNIESISLYNGQRSEILQPAKDFGNAGTIYIRTRTPSFEGTKKYNIRFMLRGGSFGLINPSLLAEYRLSERVNASLSTEWLNASGKYKFRYRRVNPSGEVAYDTVAVRQNGDIDALRLEMNVSGLLRSGSWLGKVYFYNSERGIPGAIVNNVWRRGERLWDRNFFSQGRYTGYFGRFTTLNNLKIALYRTRYVNNDERFLKIDNLYHQRELYLSSANRYEFSTKWSMSLAYDLSWNSMTASLYGFGKPTRLSHYLSAATAVDLSRLKVQASVLATFIDDRNGNASKGRKALSPAIFVSGNPLRNPELALRAFYKTSFRMPTFNDLYYTDMGNASLKPERVTQYNFGVLYDRSRQHFLQSVRVSADAYYNRVKDKIVAYPKGQQFRWTMLNLGLVDIYGIDVSALVTVSPAKDLFLTLRGQYTFQKAIDVTSPADSYYRDQIPYIPRNSGSVIFNAGWKGWNLNYSWIYVGKRYSQQENIVYNLVQPWYTSDVSLSKDFRISKVTLGVRVEVNNLFGQNYDVIINYPMPGRNFRISVSADI